jgi:hypothetical protein
MAITYLSNGNERKSRDSQPPQAVEPASVGIVLDSSVVIAAERRGRTVREILE